MDTFSKNHCMTPPCVYFHPDQARYQPNIRQWQGVASMERTAKGTMYVDFYSGMKTEESGNFIILLRSDDDGKTWRDPELVVEHPDPEIRCFDPCLWIDPLGRLWMTWNQSRCYYDGRDGVWTIMTENPDDPEPSWSKPRRIANGVMINKPIVTSKGEWIFPCSLWSREYEPPAEDHSELDDEVRANVYISNDQGKTITLRGGVDMPLRSFDENMVVELQNGDLWMLVRRIDGIGESFSSDNGKTWTDGQFSGISGPNARFFVRRLASGRILLVNHCNFRYPQGDERGFKVRSNLMAQLSEDEGKSWIGGLMLDARAEVSYPDGKQDEDGRIYVVHDFERYRAREILMHVFREEDILAGHIVSSDARMSIPVCKATGSLPTE